MANLLEPRPLLSLCIHDERGYHTVITPQWGAADAEIKVPAGENTELKRCLLYTSDAADESIGVDLGGRRIIKKIF